MHQCALYTPTSIAHLTSEEIILMMIQQGHWIYEHTVIQAIQKDTDSTFERVRGETPSQFNQMFQHSATQWYHYDNDSDRNNKSMNINTDDNNNNNNHNSSSNS